MISRLPFLSCICLVAFSCEKSDRSASSLGERSNSTRVTKSVRPELRERKEAEDQLLKARELPAGEEREKAIAKLVWDSMELNPEFSLKAFAWLTSGSDEKNRLIQQYASRLVEQDPDEAARWAASLKTEEDKALAFGRLAIVLSEEDPKHAARILTDSGITGHEFDAAVIQVIQHWSAETPQTAADWVSRFDPGEARKAGLKSITTTWMTVDPKASLAWLASLRDPVVRQEAIGGYAEFAHEQPGDMIQEEMLRYASPEMLAEFDRLKATAQEKAARTATDAEATQEN